MKDDGSATAKAKESGKTFSDDKEDKREVDRFTFKCNRDGVIGRSVGPGQSLDELIKEYVLIEDEKMP
jgi:hypothetical protein